jgi:hypothetical protein
MFIIKCSFSEETLLILGRKHAAFGFELFFERANFSLVVGFQILGVVVKSLAQHDLLLMPTVVMVLQLNLHLLAEQLSLLRMFISEVSGSLLYLLRFLFVPSSEFLRVECPYAVLNEMGLVEAAL